MRGCIHCVGEQRKKGKNVKDSTAYCNKICKRELFDERADSWDSEDSDESNESGQEARQLFDTNKFFRRAFEQYNQD